VQDRTRAKQRMTRAPVLVHRAGSAVVDAIQAGRALSTERSA
jgi:hypothetical protein